mgnify:CR=1 FL=1
MESGASEKKPVRITIFNQSFTVLAPGDPKELLATAALVDDLVTQVAKRSGHVDAGRASLLTCLHLADRIRELERELGELRDRVESKSREMASLLDRVVDGV